MTARIVNLDDYRKAHVGIQSRRVSSSHPQRSNTPKASYSMTFTKFFPYPERKTDDPDKTP